MAKLRSPSTSLKWVLDGGSCGAAGAGAHEPFAQLLEREHPEREGHDEEPDGEPNRRGAEEGIAPRRVVDQRDERDLGRDAGEDQLVAEEAAGESGSRSLRQRKTFTICMTTIALRQAVVACR